MLLRADADSTPARILDARPPELPASIGVLVGALHGLVVLCGAATGLALGALATVVVTKVLGSVWALHGPALVTFLAVAVACAAVAGLGGAILTARILTADAAQARVAGVAVVLLAAFTGLGTGLSPLPGPQDRLETGVVAALLGAALAGVATLRITERAVTPA